MEQIRLQFSHQSFIACRRIVRRCGLIILVAVAGCQGEGPKVGLKSDEVEGRILAMKEAAQQHNIRAVPALVDSLSSDDPAERMYAIEALRRITGQTLDYRYFDDDAARADAVTRWKDWLAGRPASATQKAR